MNARPVIPNAVFHDGFPLDLFVVRPYQLFSARHPCFVRCNSHCNSVLTRVMHRERRGHRHQSLQESGRDKPCTVFRAYSFPYSSEGGADEE